MRFVKQRRIHNIAFYLLSRSIPVNVYKLILMNFSLDVFEFLLLGLLVRASVHFYCAFTLEYRLYKGFF